MTEGISTDRLRELLDYNPDTGWLTWKVGRRGKAVVGAVAGNVRTDGRRCITIDNQRHKAHRLAWQHYYGEPPRQFIDHINRDPDDNRIINLRDVSASANQQNRTLTRRDGGLVGTSFDTANGKWVATIRPPKGPNRRLGSFDTESEAHEAYLAAKRELHPYACIEIANSEQPNKKRKQKQ